MAQNGIHTLTYLEKYVELSSSLPVELQRVVITLKDIDERLTALKKTTKSKVDECLAMPSASSRQASADDVEATQKARSEIERHHADMIRLSTEKVRLAGIAMEMIQYNIGNLDKELGPFTEEMKQANEAGFTDDFAVEGVAIEGMDPLTMEFAMGADFDLPPAPPLAPPEPPRLSQKKSHKKKQPVMPQPGERVAANIGEVTAGPGAQEWIVAVVVQYLPNERAYEVMDADEETDEAAAGGPGAPGPPGVLGVPAAPGGAGTPSAPTGPGGGGAPQGGAAPAAAAAAPGGAAVPGTAAAGGAAATAGGQVYHLPQELVIPMPRSALVREGQNFPQGTTVLAVYPATTTFYRAVVVQQARRQGNGEYGDFLLEFEDDGDADGLPQRPVPFMHVVRHPPTK